jgi:hypothetical protein
MALTFIGAISVAVFAACIAFIVQRWTGLFPRWIIPASAGAGMLGFTLWNDYTWFGRVVYDLPPEVVVADTFTNRNALQPWSFIVAPVNRFRAIDLRTVEPLATAPDIRRAAVFIAARYSPTFVTPQLFDCANAARADGDPSELDASGLPPPDAWVPLAPDDPLLRTVCGAPAA